MNATVAMNRRPLKYITRGKEEELIGRLLSIVDSTHFTPQTTAVVMVSPDYSATVAMHLAHAWSVRGEILPIIAVDVPYPDEQADGYRVELRGMLPTLARFNRLVLVEAGIIRGGNWKWILEELTGRGGFTRDQLTLVAMCENIHSATKSDYVGEYYDDKQEELMFYFERFNKHWPIS